MALHLLRIVDAEGANPSGEAAGVEAGDVKVILTDHDLGVLDEAVDALFRAKANVHAIALGALTLRLRGQNEPAVLPLRDNVVQLHEFSRKVGA